MRHHRLSVHAGLAVALGVMFVVLPPVVAGGTYGHAVLDNSRLVDATGRSLVEFWTAGAGSPPPALQGAADHWATYHALKAATAALLTVVLITLTRRIRRAPRSTRRPLRIARAAAATSVSGCALMALLLVMANIQGAIAPLSSVLSLLSPEQRTGDLAATTAQIHRQLSSPGSARTPALNTIVDDFARYHAALAAMAAIAAAGLALAARKSWPRSRPAGIATAVVAGLMLLLCVANVSNALAPEHGLLAFYQ